MRGEGDAFGVVDADEQRADQPRALRDREAVNVPKGRAGRGQRFADHVADLLQMLARGQLGHYAAVFPVRGDLRGDYIRAEFDAVFDDCGCRLITRTLDSKNKHRVKSTSSSHTQRQRLLRVADNKPIDLSLGKIFAQCGKEFGEQTFIAPVTPSARLADMIPPGVHRDQRAVEEPGVGHRFDQFEMALNAAGVDAVELYPAAALRRAEVKLLILFALRVNPDECLRADAAPFQDVQLSHRGHAVARVGTYSQPGTQARESGGGDEFGVDLRQRARVDAYFDDAGFDIRAVNTALELACPTAGQLRGALFIGMRRNECVFASAVIPGVGDDVQAGCDGEPAQNRNVSPEPGRSAVNERPAA